MNRIRTLIISDQENESICWKSILRQMEVQPERVSAEQLLFSSTLSTSYDLILIDTGSQQWNIALCMLLRPEHYGAILLFPRTSSESELLAGYEAGADDCIAKTHDNRVLRAKITAWCNRLQVARRWQ